MASVILSDVIDIISGGTPKTSEAKYWSGGNIDWLSINDFNNGNRFVYNSEKKITELALKESNTKLLNKGDVIISARGTVGVLAQIGKPMCFNQSCFGLRGKKGLIDNDFLYYVLKNYIHNLKKKSQGSVFDTINIKSFDLMEIDIPNYASQCSIASVLSALDKKIELNNRINAELEAMAKTLYDYWFMQFDFPDEEGKPYKSSGGKMIYNSILKREIPATFTEGVLDNLGQIVGGSTPDTKNSDNFCIKGVPWITPNDLSNNQGYKYISKGKKNVSDKGIKSASLKKYPSGTVLLTSRAPIGYMAVARNEFTTNQGFKSFVPNKGYPTDFIYYTIKNSLNIIMQFASGSTFKEISASVLKTVPIVLPPLHIVKDYTNKIDSLTKQQNVLEQECSELTNLRDWLLPMLMNGQVTIK
jgi:type I restriction enzyme, S subunit